MNLAYGSLLFLLAALWGASFLFMKVGVPEFGPIAFMLLRTFIATIVLLPLLFLRKRMRVFIVHWKELLLVGTFNTAVPFILFAYATLTLTAGTTSILNATTPMFGALIGYVWLKDKLSLQSIIGLLVGFVGVALLVVGNGGEGSSSHYLPSLAVLLATACYGWSANYTKLHLSNVNSVVFATGSQLAATVVLLPVSLFFIPDEMPSLNAWYAGIALGVACTGIAYVIFFKLIENLGPAKAVSVTYLIPFFGVIWGSIFLGEIITAQVIIGGLVILIGVAMANEVFSLVRKKPKRKEA